LPTDAEWEYACRAGANPREKTGEYAPGVLNQYAWWKENAEGQTHPVGKLRPNAWELFDMRGNVCEWLADWYGDVDVNLPREDPQGPATGTERIIRGHSYRCDAEDGFRWLWRFHDFPHTRDNNWGFRVVRTAAQ
jgi:formylglycine-generating enzyme required for sulfatase activity